MQIKFKLGRHNGHQSVFQSGEQTSQWLGLELLHLQTSKTWRGSLEGEEAALVILSGCCSISVTSTSTCRWEHLGNREDIFGGPATAVYVPQRSVVEIVAESYLEIAMPKARCETDLPPALIRPSDVKVVTSGVANWQRDVRLIIPPGSPISQRLIVGETINPPGNWSGIPPHKHDEITADENLLEEFYLFKLKPTNGYAVQLVYRDDAQDACMVSHDQVMLFENGYHPTVAPPGVTVGYLWALAGESKAYNLVIDPRFEWVNHPEPVIKDRQQA